MVWDPAFETAFHPKSVAIVGISAKAKLNSPGGGQFYNTYRELGFPGNLYLVNPTSPEVLGQKAYPSVSAIPEHIDLVIVTASAQAAPAILEDCIAAKAKNVHLFTAGFEETGEEAAKELGKRVREIALKGGIRMVGPNCMGIYVPESRIGCIHVPPKKSGPVAYIFQSGGHSDWISQRGPDYGIYFSKGVSYGNAYVLDSPDFLEYFSRDPQTKIILMYLEGIRDGRRLLRLLKKTAPEKPVILWKAGMTEAGSRAASSHTGSLAGQAAIWKAVFSQTGAVQVNSLEEMAEAAMTFLCVKPIKSKKVAVVGMGGGTSVYAADALGREGLELPPLSPETRAQLKAFIPEAGSCTRNPVDTASAMVDISMLMKEMDIVAADPNIDLIILMPHLNLARKLGLEQQDLLIKYLHEYPLHNPSGKPVVIVFHTFINEDWENELLAKLKVDLPKKGVAVYNSLSGAARALARFAEYHRIKDELKSG